MQFEDDGLHVFDRDGAPPLPPADAGGYVMHDGAKLWYATYGSGAPVVLLHGALGNSENWGHQVPSLVAAGYRAVLIDTRAHGRSTHDGRPMHYEQLAADVIAVLDALHVAHGAFVGWSDGAIVATIVGMYHAQRVTGILFFGGNMDLTGTQPPERNDPLIGRIFRRHVRDYSRLSPTPNDFSALAALMERLMQSEPQYAPADLARIAVPVTIAYAARDEFITREHTEYLARTIPGARLHELPGVSHFAPLQRPAVFNAAMLAFLATLPARVRQR